MPPAVLFFQNRGHFLHKSLGGGEQVPPAVLFFENKDIVLHKSPGGVEQVPPAFFFFKTGTFFTQALAALYRLPPACRIFEK